MEHRRWEAHLFKTQIADGRTQCRVSDAYAHDQTQREGAIDDTLAKLSVFAAILLIDMQRCRIVGQCRKENVVHFGHGTTYRVRKDLTHLELIKIQSRHTPLRKKDRAPLNGSLKN